MRLAVVRNYCLRLTYASQKYARKLVISQNLSPARRSLMMQLKMSWIWRDAQQEDARSRTPCRDTAAGMRVELGRTWLLFNRTWLLFNCWSCLDRCVQCLFASSSSSPSQMQTCTHSCPTKIPAWRRSGQSCEITAASQHGVRLHSNPA